MPAWEVLGPSTAESRFEAQHPTGVTPMVGRRREFEILFRCWSGAKAGNGRVVLLSGEPGIGKSRLTAALLDCLVEDQYARVQYFCSPRQHGSPLQPFIAQLERAAGFVRADSSSQKLAKLKRILRSDPQRPHDLVLISDLLSIAADVPYPKPQLTPKRRREETMEALWRQTELLAREKPVLVIFEDAQWIDPTSRDLLDRVITRVTAFPILLLVTFRAEFEADWNSQPHVTAIKISPLSPQECAELVENVAGKGKLPQDIVDDILDRTDGIPLYLEELTKAVLESGTSEEATKVLIGNAPKKSFAVPATLHASLMERLDRLGSAKEIAQIGAAIGREFSYELLSAVAGRDYDQLQDGLERLANAGLLVAARWGVSRGVYFQACTCAGRGVRRDASRHPP